MGVVGGDRHYGGPAITGWLPWKCPSCGVDNTGKIDDGCGSCGSGSGQARHVGVVPPVSTPRRVLSDEDAANRRPSAEAEEVAEREDLHLPALEQPPRKVVEATLEQLARAWADEHLDALPIDAFIAGYEFAARHLRQPKGPVALPAPADLDQLAPEGKARRTIIAALDLFKDQVLREAEDEIATGEWCSIAEVEQLVQQLKQEEGLL